MGLRSPMNCSCKIFGEIKSTLQLVAERAFFDCRQGFKLARFTLFFWCFRHESHLGQTAGLRRSHHLRNFFVRCRTFCSQM